MGQKGAKLFFRSFWKNACATVKVAARAVVTLSLTWCAPSAIGHILAIHCGGRPLGPLGPCPPWANKSCSPLGRQPRASSLPSCSEGGKLLGEVSHQRQCGLQSPGLLGMTHCGSQTFRAAGRGAYFMEILNPKPGQVHEQDFAVNRTLLWAMLSGRPRASLPAEE